MKAVVLHHPGPPSALKIEQRPIPIAKKVDVLINIKAFGLNRSGAHPGEKYHQPKKPD